MPEIYVSSDQIRAAESLIDVISPTSAIAHQQLAQFQTELQSHEYEGPEDILWAVKQVVDWRSGYFVDWKDTKSFVECVTGIVDRWGVSLTFGVADPLDEEFLSRNTVPDLMGLAHDELLGKGFMLWSWDTDCDSYSGWITKSTSASAVADIASTLGVQVLSGDSSF